MKRETLAWILVGCLSVLLVLALRDDRQSSVNDQVPNSGETKELSPEAAQDEQDRQRELAEEAERERFAAEIKQRANLLRKTVNKCAATVRSHSLVGRFDAYVSGEFGETVNYFGIPEDNFKFEKCMTESGHPLTK